jgi:hypothetical protein
MAGEFFNDSDPLLSRKFRDRSCYDQRFFVESTLNFYCVWNTCWLLYLSIIPPETMLCSGHDFWNADLLGLCLWDYLVCPQGLKYKMSPFIPRLSSLHTAVVWTGTKSIRGSDMTEVFCRLEKSIATAYDSDWFPPTSALKHSCLAWSSWRSAAQTTQKRMRKVTCFYERISLLSLCPWSVFCREEKSRTKCILQHGLHEGLW